MISYQRARPPSAQQVEKHIGGALSPPYETTHPRDLQLEQYQQ